MLYTDGKYEIYIIEFRRKDEPEREWSPISFDVAWVPAECRNGERRRKVWHEFSASGKCWQETGVHGTYDAEIAMVLFNMLKQYSIKKNEYLFRVVKKAIQQDSEVWCS